MARPANLELDVQGPRGPFSMSGHFERERELQGRIEAELQPALPEIEVLDVEIDDRAELVRVFIDHPDGIGFEECSAVNDVIRDTCPDHALEVSSPGLERPLRHARHFHEQVGQAVRMRQLGKHRAGLFQIVDVDDSDGVTVRPEGGDAIVVPFEQIVRCKLVAKDPFAAAGKRQKKKGRS